ncbi:hypothetical protein SCALM49S_06943 [Streptomyces californicus]
MTGTEIDIPVAGGALSAVDFGGHGQGLLVHGSGQNAAAWTDVASHLVSACYPDQAQPQGPAALRERGLLPPAEVDPRTGFRRYGLAQVERARRIALLRATGMPLARIAEVLDSSGEKPVLLLTAYWREQESAHAARRAAVSYAREVLTGGSPTMYETYRSGKSCSSKAT